MSSKKPARFSPGSLNEDDRKLWQKVTRDVIALKNDQAARPLVRRTAYRLADPGPLDASRAPAGLGAPSFGLTEQSFVLKDVDHNWRQKLRRGKVRPEGRIDLHGMTQDRAHAALSRYIAAAQQRGKRFILVVTGKGGAKADMVELSHSAYQRGQGVLRTNVPRWLSEPPLASRIVSYYAANAEHGGDGALYVILKRVRDG